MFLPTTLFACVIWGKGFEVFFLGWVLFDLLRVAWLRKRSKLALRKIIFIFKIGLFGYYFFVLSNIVFGGRLRFEPRMVYVFLIM